MAVSAPQKAFRRKSGNGLPPGPPELPVIGQTLRYISNPLGLMQEAARYGDLATMSVKPALVYLVNHPELIEEVLVTNNRAVGRGFTAASLKYLMGESLLTTDGAEHLRLRRMVQPNFHRRRVESFAQTITELTERHQRNWADGASLDIADEMSALTLHIVVKTLFGLDLPDDVTRIGDAFDIANQYITTRFNQPPRISYALHRLPVPLTVKFKRSLAHLDTVTYGLIGRRRESNEERGDLLSILLDARDPDTGKGITDIEVRDQVITLFAAGHETTAVALTWTWFLISTHPEVERRFHAELDEVLGDRPPTLDDLPGLTYTDRIITESMRLYPPIWGISRVSLEPFRLGGYDIPVGVRLACAQMITHRDARWFDAPLSFQPDRWTPEFQQDLPKFAYFPFGGGPRLCIGDHFALMEAKLALASIGRRWRMRRDERGEVGLRPLVSLRPKGGMPLTVLRRR